MLLEATTALQAALRDADLAHPIRIGIHPDDTAAFITFLQRAGVAIDYSRAKQMAALTDGYYREIFGGVAFELDFTRFDLIKAPAMPKPRPMSETHTF